MSQVKNLRAMFEQRGPSSPPERGREGASGLGDSPRPLSRVRTNFVTVEKDGRVGLHRDTSSDSIPTLSRTMSAGTEGDVPTPPTSHAGHLEARDKLDDHARPLTVVQPPTPTRMSGASPELAPPLTPVRVATPLVAVMRAAAEKAATAPVPVPTAVAAAPTEAAPSTPPAATAGQGLAVKQEPEAKLTSPAASPGKAPARKLFGKQPGKSAEAEKTASTTIKHSADAPASGTRMRAPHATNGTTTAAVKPKTDAPKMDAPKTTTASHGATSGLPLRSKTPSAASAPKEQKEHKDHKEHKEASKTATKATTGAKHVPKPISTAKAAPKVSSTTGLKAKTPTSPSKPSTPRLAAAKSTTEKKSHTATVAEKKQTPASPAPKGTGIKKPSNIQTFPPNGVGFVKPKPKSPTRPVQLPAGLTSHTAASATKTRQTQSGQSGSFLAVHGASQASATRSLSRASVSTAGTATATHPKTKTLRRQLSNVGRQRPSIGPPPKQPARDHPITKKEKVIDEGFLERLMRPTQSFTCKTADKVHQSPPRSIKSRESFGSNRSTASTARSVKEKSAPHPKPVKAHAAEASVPVPAPVAAEPVKAVAAATQPVEKEMEAAEAAPSEPIESTAAEVEEKVDTTEADLADEVAVTDAETEEAADDAAQVKAEVEAEVEASQVASEAPEDVAEKAEEKAEEKAGEEKVVEVDATAEDATPEVTPEAAAEPAKDIVHVDVAAVEDADAAVTEKTAPVEIPAAAAAAAAAEL